LLDGCGSPELGTLVAKLRNGLTALQEAAEFALAHFRQQPLEVLAGSVPLLRAFGIVAGGWQMARAALVAHRELAARRGDERVLRGKLSSAMFYATHSLPQVAALCETAVQGGESVMAMDEAAF
jgi:hypothetical protein